MNIYSFASHTIKSGTEVLVIQTVLLGIYLGLKHWNHVKTVELHFNYGWRKQTERDALTEKVKSAWQNQIPKAIFSGQSLPRSRVAISR